MKVRLILRTGRVRDYSKEDSIPCWQTERTVSIYTRQLERGTSGSATSKETGFARSEEVDFQILNFSELTKSNRIYKQI